MKSLTTIYDENEARAITRLVFENLGFNHLEIFTSSLKDLNEQQVNNLGKMQAQLLAKMPVQYVMGYAWFLNRKFMVTPACLIPRQETEELVSLILMEARKFNSIIDIGTGSGCIPISLKLESEEARVTAMEKSPDAMMVARENAHLHKAIVRFVEDDILAPVFEYYPDKFDLIVSNPPYVRESEIAFMNDNVLSFEPGEALFVKDNDPLIYYRAIREFSKIKLLPGGYIFLEVNEALASETAALFSKEEGYETTVIRDIHEKSRFVKSIWHERTGRN